MKAEIGEIFHLIHVTSNLEEQCAWYEDIFAPVRFGDEDISTMPTWPLEKRDARLYAIADTVIEPMSPSFHLEGWEKMPIGRFLNRFGPHWYSLAWYVSDLEMPIMWERMRSAGLKVFGPGGVEVTECDEETVAIFSHPFQTHGGVEFANRKVLGYTMPDPRFEPNWDTGGWARNQPLGCVRVEYVSAVTDDLKGAVELYTTVFDANPIREEYSKLTGSSIVYLSLDAGGVVALESPDRPESYGAIDLAMNGRITHAVTWRVVDLDQTERFLTSKGVRIAARDDMTLLADPATTLGAVYRFTVDKLRGE